MSYVLVFLISDNQEFFENISSVLCPCQKGLKYSEHLQIGTKQKRSLYYFTNHAMPTP